MSDVGKMRLSGHALQSEGLGYDSNGHRYGGSDPRRLVHGLCSCGALSPPLASDNARKQWHREHKAVIWAEAEGGRSMSTIVYVVSGTVGAYSDRSDWTAAVFTSE